MPIYRIDCDKQWESLRNRSLALQRGEKGALPRRTIYGAAPGLIPFGEAYPDKLVDPKDYKEIVQRCHDKKIFPVYHQHNTWAPKGFRWNQNGLNYCWAWSLTGNFMDCQAVEGKRKVGDVILAPTSLGFTVGWKNAGNYLDSAIQGTIKRGIAPASHVPDFLSHNPKTFLPGWEEEAFKNRLSPDDVWDTDRNKMIQHAITILSMGVSGYIAYNWWSHALGCVGVIWDESQTNNLVWQIRNSHDEDDIIEMTGSKAVPDELYGIRASMTPLAV